MVISHSVISSDPTDPVYKDFLIPNVSVKVQDDDKPAVLIDDGWQHPDLRKRRWRHLYGQAQQGAGKFNETVTVTLTAGQGLTLSTSVIKFSLNGGNGTVAWNAAQTVTVAVNDGIDNRYVTSIAMPSPATRAAAFTPTSIPRKSPSR